MPGECLVLTVDVREGFESRKSSAAYTWNKNRPFCFFAKKREQKLDQLMKQLCLLLSLLMTTSHRFSTIATRRIPTMIIPRWPWPWPSEVQLAASASSRSRRSQPRQPWLAAPSPLAGLQVRTPQSLSRAILLTSCLLVTDAS